MARRSSTPLSAADDRGDIASDYTVGRAKPPKHSQFKPGTSGNPGGRRKGSLNMKTIWSEVAETEVTIIEKGVPTKVFIPKALVLRLIQEALKGDIRAINSSFEHFERYCPPEPANTEDGDLSAEDRALLARAQSRQACRTTRRKQVGARQSGKQAAGAAKASGDDESR